MLSQVSGLNVYREVRYGLGALARRLRNLTNNIEVAALELLTNNRHLVGLMVGMVGGVSIFFYLLFDPAARDHSWYYLNYYFLFFDLRLWLVMVFGSISFLLLCPAKWKLAWIGASIPATIGFIGLIHYTVFVDSYDTYHALPIWYVWMIGAGLGVGCVIAADYLCYRKYHLKDGNSARIKGIIMAPGIDAETKMKLLVGLIEEQEAYNARI